jgi:hypothetical protein
MTKKGATTFAIFAFLVSAPVLGLSQKTRLKIMPLGDSITWGTPDSSY